MNNIFTQKILKPLKNWMSYYGGNITWIPKINKNRIINSSTISPICPKGAVKNKLEKQLRKGIRKSPEVSCSFYCSPRYSSSLNMLPQAYTRKRISASRQFFTHTFIPFCYSPIRFVHPRLQYTIILVVILN